MGVLPLGSISRYTQIRAAFPSDFSIFVLFAKKPEWSAGSRVPNTTRAQLREPSPLEACPQRAFASWGKFNVCSSTGRP